MCAEIYERFTFWRGFRNTANKIKNKLERALFVSAIVDYALDGIEPDFKNLLACAGVEPKDDKLLAFEMGFEGIRKDIEHSRKNAQYQDTHRKKQKEQEKNTLDDCILTVSKPSDDSNLTPSDIDKDIDKDIDNNNAQMEFALDATSSGDFSYEDFRKQYPFKETVNGQKPRRVLTDRKKEEAAFKRLSKAEREAVKASIPKYHAFLRATGEYQKNALTFLHGRNWEDDYSLPDVQTRDESERQGGFDNWLAQEDKRRTENG